MSDHFKLHFIFYRGILSHICNYSHKMLLMRPGFKMLNHTSTVKLDNRQAFKMQKDEDQSLRQEFIFNLTF